MERLTEDELRQLAAALKTKVESMQSVGYDEGDWDPIFQVVVDTELVVSGALPLSAFTEEDGVVEVGPESPLFESPEDPYLWESGT